MKTFLVKQRNAMICKISSIPVLPCKYEILPSSTQDDNNDEEIGEGEMFDF